ncbi:MAG: UvrD-helicase domain-containing protein [Bacteroidota bacterium]
MPKSSFSIYNASAGSGKTFTLVKNYLLLLFASKSLLSFRHILALTFTNKAVGEMKSRIIETLEQFSDNDILESHDTMFKLICEELKIEPPDLHLKSKKLLETIVHNYAAFDISTIDKFNHRLIRVFAYDLKLPVNFEVELDTDIVLSKSVDQLIDMAGNSDELTKVLVDFAIEKADDDRSWDISHDFNTIAKLLINENEIPFIKTIKDKNLSDFNNLKQLLHQKVKVSESKIKLLGNQALELISSNGLEFSDFNRSTLPKHFSKVITLNFNGLYSNKLEENLKERNGIYSKTLDAEKASIIESLLPQFESIYLNIKQEVHQSKIYSNAIRNITPLSVLNAIQKSLSEIKEDEDILLISEFNSIINSEIKNQPAPFIYERIGEKFKHYFIDEFQDTSVLQWENLVPLVSNALSGENLSGKSGSLMLVGDAKQAIYRWRGGRAEQFIALYSGDNPFFIESQDEYLPINYRSYRSIVDFNNRFFNFLSGRVFTNQLHAELYKKSRQEFSFENQGYVNLNFLTIDETSKDEAYCNAVFETLQNVRANGFQLKDICIIVRKKKEGVAIAQFLNEKEIPIISSETLLINNSQEVQFLNNLLSLSINFDDELSKVELLTYLAEFHMKMDDIHTFLANAIGLGREGFCDFLKSIGYEFNLNTFSELPIYDAIESGIRAFKLNKEPNAYIQFYLDEVLDYSQKNDASFEGFLTYWDSKKERLSIVSPEGQDAVQIMTIHKSKGLEFPVVIFPYANQDIYFDLRPKIWFPVDKNEFSGFSHLYLNLNKDLEEFNDTGRILYQNYRANLELDSINLLYVVLTRAVEQLYIISEMDLDKTSLEKPNLYSGLFIGYLKEQGLWNVDNSQYEFGHPDKIELQNAEDSLNASPQTINEELNSFISTEKESHNLTILTNSGLMWDTEQADAIERGNLVHNIMAKIETVADVEATIQSYENSGKLNQLQSKKLLDEIRSIVFHPQLKHYFDTADSVYNERDILTSTGRILRPDRLVIDDKNEAVIIDYKTGLSNPKHLEQLYDYQNVLEEMSIKVTKKFLVYMNESIVLKEF